MATPSFIVSTSTLYAPSESCNVKTRSPLAPSITSASILPRRMARTISWDSSALGAPRVNERAASFFEIWRVFFELAFFVTVKLSIMMRPLDIGNIL